MEFDHVLKIVGEFGPHQRRLYVLLCLSIVPAAIQLLLLVFVAAQPHWICLNSSTNETCPKNKLQCTERQYTSKYTSIITEWDLVCENAYKADLVQSLLMSGTLLGALMFGALADKYGRRRVWHTTLTGLVVFGFASSFAPTFKIYATLRFLTGFCIGGEILSAFVLATELVGPSYRGFAGIMAQCFFTLGLLILPMVAYLIQDWRTLSVVLSLPASVFILFFRYVPESARWLMIRGRVSEAENILLDIALKNGIAVPKSLLQVNHPFFVGSRYGFFDLFCTRKIVKQTFVLIFIWFVNTLVYYGLSLNTKHLAGDIYMNFFLCSLMEFPAYLTCLFFVNWAGRRKTLFNYMVLAGLACMACMFVQPESSPADRTLATVFAMIGKFGITASFALIYIYSAEIFPTVVRNVGLGVCSMSSRIGGICAPFVVFLGTYMRPLPMVIFGMCAFMAGLLSLMLPETHKRPLPETMDDKMFKANDSDFEYDDDLVTEKSTFI
ncbi:predicted protein [Nematostella vectensis]|uniref:Major facilitator superfamily (MFS) profile domain-containing protein n=1 Tax=Nematostella vectensis TaxID=45351 RepID=A7RR13_NEMVE|nr:predicted protein [Nematostella vectensis]|eukprot:XP_001638150.1 predicted protein [Nematostella vectensis]